MNRIRRLGIMAALAAACGAAVWACADGGYDTSWAPEGSSEILSPGNDTRSNFILLMADRYGTRVADPAVMAKGIVPFDFPYKVMIERLEPGTGDESFEAWNAERAAYGLSDENDNSYFAFDSGKLGLCHTNRSGAEQFDVALKADGAVPQAEKAALTAARGKLAHACDKAGDLAFELGAVASPEGRAFAHYVEGTRLFYAEALPKADAEFAAVGTTGSGWLTETAAYMRFRTALAEAMKGSIGQWGEIEKAAERDQAAVGRAEAARARFLAAFPNGRYAKSARDLERRIAWLRGDDATLGAAYSAMLAKSPRAGGLPDIDTMEEADRRMLPSSDAAGVTDPTLLAVADLMRLRPDQGYDKERSCCGAWLTREEMERQRPVFAAQPDLFGFLVAAEAYYHRHQPREVLALIPDAARQARFSYTQFSRQMLRGFALEDLGDRNARAFWLSLLPGAVQPYQRAAVELAIFQHDREAGVVGRLLETGSPILHPLIRQKIIEDDAGPALLRQQATEGMTKEQRDVALYLLLADELHHGWYSQFLADRKLVGPREQPKDSSAYTYQLWSVADYDPKYVTALEAPPLSIFADGGSDNLQGCPNIETTAASLAADGSAVRPRLCLAEFIRERGLDGWTEHFDGTHIVSASRNHFPGKPLERIDIYRDVIADPNASADDKAFALNRAIRCYAPAGNSSCGLGDEDLSVRKARFVELKRDYPNSPWAKDLKTYW